MVAIVDYKAGNLFSVKNAFDKLGIDSVITSEVDVIKKADKILLPGVGTFKNAMDNFKKYNLADTIVSEVNNEKLFFGICLGMQLLFNSSEEFGHSEGLKILDGKVIHFKENGLKIPHMGWNSITNCSGTKLFSDLENEFVYFVHSYHLVSENADYKQIMTNYGYDFCSAVEYKNIFATQFHPEKSGDVGFEILKRFGEL
ncbi:MAG: imidazole glycerol phosphate synthase subunit HisH [Lachnospiraceae bacterium]|nr:imidazole glycerol phosphate synthase subunit HisH [Lachnospiraceae bacterium]